MVAEASTGEDASLTAADCDSGDEPPPGDERCPAGNAAPGNARVSTVTGAVAEAVPVGSPPRPAPAGPVADGDDDDAVAVAAPVDVGLR